MLHVKCSKVHIEYIDESLKMACDLGIENRALRGNDRRQKPRLILRKRPAK